MNRLWQRHRTWVASVILGGALFAFAFWVTCPRPLTVLPLPQPETTSYEIVQFKHKPTYGHPNPPEYTNRWTAIRYYRGLDSGFYFLDQQTVRLPEAWHVPKPKWAHLMTWRFDRDGRFVVVYHGNKRGHTEIEVVYWFRPGTLETGSARDAKAIQLARLTPPVFSTEFLGLPAGWTVESGEPYVIRVSPDGRHVLWCREMPDDTVLHRVTRPDLSSPTKWFRLPDELEDGIFVTGTTQIVAVSEPNLQPNQFQSFAQDLLDRIGARIRTVRPRGDQAFLYDWKSQQSISFRSTEPETIDGYATQKERITLLIDAYGPNPRLEIWNAPPPQRPVMAIWILSLLVACATWFRLRRREKQRVAKS